MPTNCSAAPSRWRRPTPAVVARCRAGLEVLGNLLLLLVAARLGISMPLRAPHTASPIALAGSRPRMVVACVLPFEWPCEHSRRSSEALGTVTGAFRSGPRRWSLQFQVVRTWMLQAWVEMVDDCRGISPLGGVSPSLETSRKVLGRAPWSFQNRPGRMFHGLIELDGPC